MPRSRQGPDPPTIFEARLSLCGFIGPNGAGKTTTIRKITAILFPDRGEMEVLGHRRALAAATPMELMTGKILAQMAVGLLMHGKPPDVRTLIRWVRMA